MLPMEVLPRDTFYNRISTDDGEQQTEIAFAKQRWNDDDKDDNIDNKDENKKVYDPETNTSNLANKKATDIRSNQRVKLVDPDIDDKKEMKRDVLKAEIVNTYEKYKEEYCYKNGEIKGTMTNDMKEGMKSAKEKVKVNKIVVIETDKTRRTCVTPPDKYKDSMEEHVKNDRNISKKELNKIERKLNDHSKSTARMFKIADNHGQFKRAMRNSTVHQNGQLPIMKGAEKDHKPVKNNVVKMRPMLNTMDGPKKNISDTYSDIIDAIVKSNDEGYLCSSTEELLATFEEYNKSIQGKGEEGKERIIGSMDAVSLYTKLEAEMSLEIIREETRRS